MVPDVIKPSARRTPATMLAEASSTPRLMLLLNAEGKIRNLSRTCQPCDQNLVIAETHAIMMRKADSVADAFQYHLVRSFSLYRSMSVRRGFHFGSGVGVGLRTGLRIGLRIGLRMLD